MAVSNDLENCQCFEKGNLSCVDMCEPMRHHQKHLNEHRRKKQDESLKRWAKGYVKKLKNA